MTAAYRFVGRVALVTGGGTGIGRAAALRFAREGAVVALDGTAPAPAEIVTAVRVPVPAAGNGTIYHKFVTRSSEDRPCVGVFASCKASDEQGCNPDERAKRGPRQQGAKPFRPTRL